MYTRMYVPNPDKLFGVPKTRSEPATLCIHCHGDQHFTEAPHLLPLHTTHPHTPGVPVPVPVQPVTALHTPLTIQSQRQTPSSSGHSSLRVN